MKNNRLLKLLMVLGLFSGFIFAKNYYQEIGVGSSATAEEISSKCREQMVKSHPHKNDNSVDAHEKFTGINHACEVLKNKETRALYDVSLQQGRHSAASGRGSTLAIEAPVSKKKPPVAPAE